MKCRDYLFIFPGQNSEKPYVRSSASEYTLDTVLWYFHCRLHLRQHDRPLRMSAIFQSRYLSRRLGSKGFHPTDKALADGDSGEDQGGHEVFQFLGHVSGVGWSVAHD